MLVRSTLAVLAGVATLTLLTARAAAQTSFGSMSFQARLEGVPNEPVRLTVQFWNGPAPGGIPVGSPINVQGQVVEGVVSVPLPIADPAIFNGQTLYAGVKVNGGPELSPRILVTSVPYALSVGIMHFDPANNRLEVAGSGREDLIGLEALAEGGYIYVKDAPTGNPRVMLRATPDDLAGQLDLTDGNSRKVRVHPTFIRGEDNNRETWRIQTAGAGVMRLFDQQGGNGIVLYGHDGSIHTRVLHITGGSDLAEPVPVSGADADIEPEPGMVMVIDSERDGALVPCSAAYDKAVAGVLSGANGLNPGLLLSAEGHEHAGAGEDTMPLAMSGRVWVWCDASFGAISRGDSLTTSPMPGHAMVVTDDVRRPGAVIGKAMTRLDKGRGLVLVLVNLQ